MNADQKKDFTADGLYQPEQASGERKTGPSTEAARPSEGEQRAERVEPAQQKDSTLRRPKKIDDDEVWAKSPEQTTLSEQPAPARPAPSTSDRFSVDSETSKKLQTGALMASIAAFLYCLCLKRNPQQVPKRRYGALGPRDPEGDSDGDDGDDPRERRRMLELSSFGGEGSGQGAYRRGRRGETTAAGSDS